MLKIKKDCFKGHEKQLIDPGLPSDKTLEDKRFMLNLHRHAFKIKKDLIKAVKENKLCKCDITEKDCLQ